MVKKKSKNHQINPEPVQEESPQPQEIPIEMPPEPQIEEHLKKELPPELIIEMPSAKSMKSPKPKPEPVPEPIPVCTPTITLEEMRQQLTDLKEIVENHTKLIAFVQLVLSKKRTPVKSNGKVSIFDKNTGITYPSKNNAYQSLLKSGELTSMVQEGVFGPVPEKNTFGWYTLERSMPDRFQEVPGNGTIPNAQ